MAAELKVACYLVPRNFGLAGLRAGMLVCLGACGHMASLEANGQTPRPSFEVAAIKPVTPDDGVARRDASQEALDSAMPPGWLPVMHHRLTIEDRSLRNIIAHAYRVHTRQISGPAWLGELRFDVIAKLPADASSRSANEMLQSLLEERFGLRLHRESKDVPGYELVLGAGTVRLKPAAPPEGDASSPQELADRKLAPAKNPSTAGIRLAERRHYSNATTTVLAETLTQPLDAPVVDRTSLQGKFDIELDIPAPEWEDDTIDHRLSEALSPLGLKLKRAKVRTEVLVIDAINKTPTPN
jgi:uncharacterized protein (TIGR03435 family)